MITDCRALGELSFGSKGEALKSEPSIAKEAKLSSLIVWLPWAMPTGALLTGLTVTFMYLAVRSVLLLASLSCTLKVNSGLIEPLKFAAGVKRNWLALIVFTETGTVLPTLIGEPLLVSVPPCRLVTVTLTVVNVSGGLSLASLKPKSDCVKM